MEFSDIIVYAVVALAVIILGQRFVSRGRGTTPVNPPDNRPGTGVDGDAFPNTRDARGADGPEMGGGARDDIADEVEDDVKSQHRERSI